jgi:hypothetical protein
VDSFLERYATAYRAEMDAFVAMITKGATPLADQNDGLCNAPRSFRLMLSR